MEEKRFNAFRFIIVFGVIVTIASVFMIVWTLTTEVHLKAEKYDRYQYIIEEYEKCLPNNAQFICFNKDNEDEWRPGGIKYGEAFK